MTALLGACAAVGAIDEPPKVSLVQLEPESFELFEQRYRLRLRIRKRSGCGCAQRQSWLNRLFPFSLAVWRLRLSFVWRLLPWWSAAE